MNRPTPRARPAAAFVLAALVLLSVVWAGAALAHHLDPRKQIRPADQARARAMLLTTKDLGPGVRTQPSSPEAHFDCGNLSFEDLTITGEATSRTFVAGTTVYASSAELYRTTGDSTASWQRASSNTGVACAASMIRRGYARQGLELDSFRKRPFPRVAQRTAAYEAVLSGQVQGLTVELTLGVVGIQQGRAQASFVWGSVYPLSRAEELRLARLVAQRMENALRRTS